jgi:hypothetical protein
MDLDMVIQDVVRDVLPRFGVNGPEAFTSVEDHEDALRFVADEVEAVLATRPGLAAAPVMLASIATDAVLDRVNVLQPAWAREAYRPYTCGCCLGGDYQVVFGDRPALPQGWSLAPRPLF